MAYMRILVPLIFLIKYLFKHHRQSKKKVDENHYGSMTYYGLRFSLIKTVVES